MNTQKNPTTKTAVILFQLGGPDSLDAVEPFLYNLFCDPDIINFPLAFLARKPLAKFIVWARSKKVKEHYREIGGKSPIRDLTEAQAKALGEILTQSHNVTMFVAMRYWKPSTEEVIQQIKKGNFTDLIFLPLYPQYSITTTGSSLNEWNRLAKIYSLDLPSQTVDAFYTNDLYIQSLVERVNEELLKFASIPPEKIQLVFSAHGLPVSIIEKGDPYQKHIEKTVELVMQKGKWKSPHLLCYQSKVGPAQWLKPSLNDTIAKLGVEKKDNLLVIPVAFVTDHIETLHEINIETRELAEQCGIHHFEVTKGLNNSKTFIQALAELVLEKINRRNTDTSL